MSNNFEIITKEPYSFDSTINLKKLIGKRVLSKSGVIIGRVKEIRLNNKRFISGIIVKRGFKRIFFGESYIERISEDGAILNIDPSILLKGIKVISSEGEYLGKVKKIERKDYINDISFITVKSFWRKSFDVGSSYIKSFGKSIMLKPNYNAPKKYFWQRSK